jgi:hypothetical protein
MTTACRERDNSERDNKQQQGGRHGGSCKWAAVLFCTDVLHAQKKAAA